ncbi:MAG: zinc ribbon domain-containing protein [Hespellia sp.]|jgi:hypothetical protein|nr:zinc ribbon domain-containing protein [Hespellia sp.]
MRDFLEDLGKKIGETAESFTNKAGEVVEVQRIRSQIRALDRNNERDFHDIGRMVYDKYKDGEAIDTEIVCICEEIEKREATVEEMEQMIADVKGDSSCPECQKPVGKGMSFCPNCGAKIEEAKEVVEDIVDEVKDTVKDVEEAAAETAEEVKDAVEEKIEDVKEAAKETVEDIKDAVEE